MTRHLAAAVALLLVAAGPPPPADDAAAEIGLWQAVTARNLRTDYEGYLLLFPNGRFAGLARLRIQDAAPPPTPPPPVADVSLYHLDVTPQAAPGQPVTVRCRGFLPAALFDLVVVVRAGTPDLTAAGALDESQLLVKGLAKLYDVEGAGIGIPALPPGAYEVRYVSRQYNPGGRAEVMARAPILFR